MSALEANQARYYFEPADLAPETLHVVDFAGQETISQLFRFDLNLVSKNPQINFAEVINKPATFTMRRGNMPVKIHGLIADFQQGGRTAEWVAYRATLVPLLWLLALNYQSRVFQNMTVQEIVTQVLREAGFTFDDFRFVLKDSYKLREYCVQYRETDLNFISRLLEFEGIYFFFQHGDARATLVITDDPGESPFIAGERAIRYHTNDGFAPPQNAEIVREFVCQEKIVTGKVVLKDYNYRTPEATLSSASQLNDDMPGLYYEYGQHFKDSAEGNRLAKVRNEEIECGRRVMTGDSDCMGLRSGFKFTLQHHYRDDLNGNYLITQISHSGAQGAWFTAALGASQAPTYRNHFICIPAEAPYRPPRLAPEPRIPGIMTAKIETAGGDYAYIDDDGRYRVKMPFDLSETNGGGASRAIRLAQPYSGSNYGIHFPNRANTEMVWACIDGNVDRPLGLSTVPNPANASPAVAGNREQCVIRTAGQNELMFDDNIGSENIYLHATKDWTIDIANDKKQTIGNNESAAVGNNRSRTVGNDETVSIGNNETTSISNNATRTVGKDETIAIGNNRSKTIGKDQSESIGANKTMTVGGNHSETVAGNMKQAVAKSKKESIRKTKSLSVGLAYQVKVGGMMTLTVGGAKNESVGLMSDEKIGLNKTINAGKKITLNAGEELVFKCGTASITLKKDGKVIFKGCKISQN